MKRNFILAALLVFFVTSTFAQRPPTLTDDDVESVKAKPMESPTTKTSSAWEEFSSEEGGFAVKWPERPSERSQKVDYDSGQFEQKMFAVQRAGIIYSVIYFDIQAPVKSAEELERRFGGVRKRILKNNKVKLESETAMTMAGYNGKEFIVSDGEQLVTMKVFAVGKRFYNIATYSKKGEDSSELETQFFSSFRILEQ